MNKSSYRYSAISNLPSRPGQADDGSIEPPVPRRSQNGSLLKISMAGLMGAVLLYMVLAIR
jgi:hypothetical protein